MSYGRYADSIKSYEENGKWIVEEGKQRDDKKRTFSPNKRYEYNTEEEAEEHLKEWERKAFMGH